MNLPTLLTWLRIVTIPLVALAFFLPLEWARPLSTLFFTIAAVTDAFDGWLARRWNQTTAFGAFLDPVADKLLVAVSLVLLVQDGNSILVTMMAAVIIGREITVSALREWMAQVGARARVAVSPIGKSKTIVQMVGIGMMLFHIPLLGIPVYEIGLVLLFVASVVTLWSMADYLRAAWPELTARHRVPNEEEHRS
ncbi:MAG: CDP-diacylglycerol--glycerol-3-phosphate 3-phosphatidyltransferase [Gammaproteobacteria bacterium]|nr:CDP-diacylglycerol--glycerol-3-phosphate 3-phosphatidyltransferase [Gammaproteobacteria bacterium]TVQ45219.1 MAG: CDP-diacylglycerol--glycerol-3-phosphate 3-phosphatidyltransferase [Gammaproteobacteria bacterium]